ncbi:MAG: sigma 54-interacting transcriptional regulator, partial [Bacteroidota bacterium]
MREEHTIREEYNACRIQRLKLEAVFNSVSDGIIALDEHLQVTNLNRSALQMTAFSSVDIVSKSFIDIFCPKNEDARTKLVSSLHAKELLLELETEIVTKNGQTRRVIVNTNTLDDDSEQFAGFVIVFRDVSELYKLKEEVKGRYRFGNIIGKNNKMQDVYELILQIASSHATVLLEGESGTGKQLVAQAIHFNSSRAEKPFVTVNCSALPETLLESELFGHVKGAFTGAVADKIGRFEAANGGTIF